MDRRRFRVRRGCEPGLSGKYESGAEIEGLETIVESGPVQVFHAGTSPGQTVNSSPPADEFWE